MAMASGAVALELKDGEPRFCLLNMMAARPPERKTKGKTMKNASALLYEYPRNGDMAAVQ